VTGVRTATGETLDADLVVDAMGRGSRMPRWLRDAGVAPIHEESEDSGFIYYTRFFRAANGSGGVPQPRMPLLTPIGSISVLTLPGDNATWSVTLFISSGDQPLKRLRHADRFSAVIEACPMHAHWLDGEPITDVEAMGGVIDRYRRIAVDGRPVVTGVALVADAWACTNPSVGRGITLGLLHAKRLRDVVREHGEHPRAFADAWDAITEAELTPWYRDTIAEDRARLREIEALRAGIDPGPPATPEAQLRAALITAIPHDPDVFRAFIASRACVRTLRESLTQPGFAEYVLAVAEGKERRPPPGPNRDQLLQLAAA
jgi:flavin-dependent dehydrogenase